MERLKVERVAISNKCPPTQIMAVAAAPRRLRSGSLSSGEDSYSEEENSGRMKSYVSQVKKSNSANNFLDRLELFFVTNIVLSRHLLVPHLLRESHHHLVQEGLPRLPTHPLVERNLVMRGYPLSVGGADDDRPHLLKTRVRKKTAR